MACARQLQCFLFLALISPLPTALAAARSNISLTGCPSKCGNITIPYPFGMGTGCYRDGFEITCNKSTTHPRAFLFRDKPFVHVELMDINITSGEARIYNKNISYVCFNQKNSISNIYKAQMMLPHPAFLFSHQRNKFLSIGCSSLASISGSTSSIFLSGCVSYCESQNGTTGDGGSCNGMGCCQAAIPTGLSFYVVFWDDLFFTGSFYDAWKFNPCNYAMLVEDGWYKFQVRDLSGFDFYKRNKNGVPVVLDWAIRDNSTCEGTGRNTACLSSHSFCYNTSTGAGYLCQCRQGYEGNPYLTGGCIDIDECKSPNKYPCSSNAFCTNSGGNFTCSCPKGTYGNPYVKHGNCIKNLEKFSYRARVALASILGVTAVLILGLLVVIYLQHKRRMEEKEEYKKYYQMMDDHLRVFSTKQLENATNNFSETNVLGAGGQGKVYKGLLENNQAVAIKKVRDVEETQRGEFVNEIILLSQINHKNIVRLLGCCLEVKIPMLVYEFVPNGTIYHLLHRNKTSPISLATRLNIALESAMALDYMHSSISRSIIHGDVKTANILLDADYTVKVSDFGASSIVPIDKIVDLVHFSPGYLDPECLYTQIITKNTDVYSFGVVILELITRKEAVYLDEKGEKQSLATGFLSKARRNEHREMLDVELLSNDEKVMEVLDKICAIAVQCLRSKGEDRPTMWQIVEELLKLVRLHNSSRGFQTDPEEADSLVG